MPKYVREQRFTKDDPDLPYQLRDYISVKLDPFRPHVSAKHIIDTEKYLAADLHKKFMTGRQRAITGRNPTFDYNKKMQVMAKRFGCGLEEMCGIACSLPALLAEDAPPLADELLSLQQKQDLSPAALRKLVDNPAKLLTALKAQKPLPSARIAPTKPRYVEKALQEEVKENKISATRPARRMDPAPPVSERPKTKPFLSNRDRNDYDMVPLLTGETLLPDGFFRRVHQPKSWMKKGRPETAASKIILLAAGVDLGLLAQGDAHEPYSRLQKHVAGNGSGHKMSSLILRLVLARTYGAAFFAPRYDAEDVFLRNLDYREETDNLHVVTLPVANMQKRFQSLHPGVEPDEWIRQQGAVLAELDSHTRRFHFALDPEKLDMDIMPTHPHFQELVEHRYRSARRLFGKKYAENDADVTSLMERRYPARAPGPDGP